MWTQHMKESELFFTYLKKFIEQEEFLGQPNKFGGQAQRDKGRNQRGEQQTWA